MNSMLITTCIIIVILLVLMVFAKDNKVYRTVYIKRNEQQVHKPKKLKNRRHKNVIGDGPHKYISKNKPSKTYNGIRNGMYDGPIAYSVRGAGVVPSESLKYTASNYEHTGYTVPIVGPGANPDTYNYNKLNQPLINGEPVQDFYRGANEIPYNSEDFFPSESTLFNSLGYRGPYSSPYLGLEFLGSVDANAVGFKAIDTKWEKIGLLTTTNENDDSILNLYQRDIAPYRDLYEYAAQDKNGFILPLNKNITYLEEGDIVDHVVGKDTEGPWKAHLFYRNKYIYV